jgi:hypothetical protein
MYYSRKSDGLHPPWTYAHGGNLIFGAFVHLSKRWNFPFKQVFSPVATAGSTHPFSGRLANNRTHVTFYAQWPTSRTPTTQHSSLDCENREDCLESASDSRNMLIIAARQHCGPALDWY